MEVEFSELLCPSKVAEEIPKVVLAVVGHEVLVLPIDYFFPDGTVHGDGVARLAQEVHSRQDLAGSHVHHDHPRQEDVRNAREENRDFVLLRHLIYGRETRKYQ